MSPPQQTAAVAHTLLNFIVAVCDRWQSIALMHSDAICAWCRCFGGGGVSDESLGGSCDRTGFASQLPNICKLISKRCHSKAGSKC